jgi:NAD(P)-dependent dehydrogenase (short-subunit alcohol dehydrogenase family)
MHYLEKLFSLEGKIALVTGASRGLGQGIAEALLGAGATVILTSATESRLSATTEAFRQLGLSAHLWPCDLADRSQITELVNHIQEKFGRLDILVNNAGVTQGHDLVDYPDDLWDRTFQINVEAAFFLVRGFAAMMKAQGSGSIINITSLNAELGFPNNPAYVAAKGALKQLGKSLAVDLGPFGVRVNNIGPGYFHTDMNVQSWNDPQRQQQRADKTLLGRWGEPQDLAGVAVLLASDASAYITGQDIYVDGGWLAKGL